MLKKDNYIYKDYGPRKAIAMISNLEIRENGYTVATFDIKGARDGDLIDQVKVPFKFVRTENPMETAYNTAKGVTLVKRWSDTEQKVVEVEEPNSFHGWEDDIV